MTLPVEINPLLLSQTSGYTIGRSLRFRSSASAYLARTPSVAGNQQKWTWSGWVKRGQLGSNNQTLFVAYSNTTNYCIIQFSNDTLFFDNRVSTDTNRVTTAVYRDPSAWYHIIVAVDTTQATASNRVLTYVNGVQVTSFSNSNYPAQNTNLYINSLLPHYIGCYSPGNNHLDGYLAEVNFIDGQALTPSSFGAFDVNGVWQPIKYAGTYGTNGFYLPFSDNSSGANLALDKSGNGNNWTPNNISAATGSAVSVAAATGGTPIYVTTDTYGTVKGTGVNSDANASSLVLDVPMGTSAGLDINDQSPTGRTSAAKTLTNNGSIVVSTSVSKFYGGSADLTAAGRYFSLANTTDFDMGTGNFTLETWIYPTAGECRLMCGVNPTGECAAIPGSGIYIGISGVGGQVLGGTIVTNKWQHVAFVRIGGTIYGYIDGVPCPLTYAIGAATAFSFTTGTGSIIGRNHLSAGTAVYCPAYLQDFRVYKGVAKYTSSFNPPSSTVNSTAAITYDSMIDSPTVGPTASNYAVLNPLRTASSSTISNGNLTFTDTTNNHNYLSTIGMTSSKWYFEFVAGTTSFAAAHAGIALFTISADTYVGSDTNGYAYHATTGQVLYNNVALGTYSTWTGGDVIGVAYDADAGKMYVAKNGTWQNSGDPAAGTGAVATGIASNTWFFGIGGNPSSTLNANFGQRPFTYTPPTGFKALNTYNLPAPTISAGKKHFDVSLWTGTGATQAVTNSGGFQPDLVWLKSRNATYFSNNNNLYDSVRGANKGLFSDLTNAETTFAARMNSFDSSGFTVSTDYNASGMTAVGWQWKGGGTGVSNTAGTITSTVSANPTAGFSVVTYTGNGTNGATVGHGLGVTPAMVIVKNRSTAGYNWQVWHKSLTTNYNLQLDQTSAQFNPSAAAYGGPTAPSSTIFTCTSGATNARSINFLSDTYVAYSFAEVAGFSKFGSYTGNGAADGPFVYCGFRPRWIMIKRTDAAANWFVEDSARSTYNQTAAALYPNLSNAEDTSYPIDFTSNGFKIRNDSTAPGFNASGGTYIFAAFAENPFNNSRAR